MLFSYIIIFHPYQPFELSLAPFLGEIDICSHWQLFCIQFNAQQLLLEEFFNITYIFGVIHNYINIAVYGIFFFSLSELSCNSHFAPNTASLLRLPTSGSYLFRFSINISCLSIMYIFSIDFRASIHVVQSFLSFLNHPVEKASALQLW